VWSCHLQFVVLVEVHSSFSRARCCCAFRVFNKEAIIVGGCWHGGTVLLVWRISEGHCGD
jgi:hypothetical protein